MPRAASVFIHYGPYESCGIVEHREERLKGLQSKLFLNKLQNEFLNDIKI